MSFPLSATVARLNPARDKLRNPLRLPHRPWSFPFPASDTFWRVFLPLGRPRVQNFCLTRLSLAIALIPLVARAASVGAASTRAPEASTLLPPKTEDSAETQDLPKVASTFFFLVALFLVSIGFSYFCRCYVFSRDRPECWCEKRCGNTTTVSPEAVGLKGSSDQRATPADGIDGKTTVKTGLYANIFARGHDSDEEEIRELELMAMEAAVAEEEESELKNSKKAARPSRTSILKALETANKHKITRKDSRAEPDPNVEKAAKKWMEIALDTHDENDNIPGKTVKFEEKDSNHATQRVPDDKDALTTVVVHRNPSPLPATNALLVPADDDLSIVHVDQHHTNEGYSETPRTPRSDLNTEGEDTPRFLSSNHEDIDGYSTDFESISLHSDVTHITTFRRSSESRQLKTQMEEAKNSSPGTGENADSRTERTHKANLKGENISNSVSTSNTQHERAMTVTKQKSPTNTKDDRKTSQQSSDKNTVAKIITPQSKGVKHKAETNTTAVTSAKAPTRPAEIPTLADTSGKQADRPPPGGAPVAEEDDDDTPRTPDSGTRLLPSPEPDDNDEDNFKKTDKEEPGDTPRSEPEPTTTKVEETANLKPSNKGSEAMQVYAKYANNAKLPNMHVMGGAKNNDSNSVASKHETVSKPNGTSVNKEDEKTINGKGVKTSKKEQERGKSGKRNSAIPSAKTKSVKTTDSVQKRTTSAKPNKR